MAPAAVLSFDPGRIGQSGEHRTTVDRMSFEAYCTIPVSVGNNGYALRAGSKTKKPRQTAGFLYDAGEVSVLSGDLQKVCAD